MPYYSAVTSNLEYDTAFNQGFIWIVITIQTRKCLFVDTLSMVSVLFVDSLPV